MVPMATTHAASSPGAVEHEAGGEAAGNPTRRRRRPTMWDVREPQYGIPMPPPGQLPPPAGPPAAGPVFPPMHTQVPPRPASQGGLSRSIPGSVVSAPPPNSSGALAGIDIDALRALIAPGNSALLSGRGNAGGGGFSSSAMPAAAAGEVPLGSPQHATRHARRLYVGNLPASTNDAEVGDFFNRALIHARGVGGLGNPVLSVYLNLEKRFAFIELRSLPETAAALAMDGVLFRNMSLRMRRPNDYNEAACPPLPPPPGFDPSMLGIVSTQVGDGPNKVFIGGIPYSLNEDDVKVLLQTHGRLAAFNLIKDPNTGLSKGFAFFEYADPSVVDQACKTLNGSVVDNKTLTVRRATQHPRQQGGLGGGGGPGGVSGAGPGQHGPHGPPQVAVDSLLRHATRIVALRNVITDQELADDEEYQEVVEETEDEARKFGNLQKVLVPRPSKNGGEEVKGVGCIFLMFEKSEEAERAFAAMDGRKFDDRVVVATYISEEDFDKGSY